MAFLKADAMEAVIARLGAPESSSHGWISDLKSGAERVFHDDTEVTRHLDRVLAALRDDPELARHAGGHLHDLEVTRRDVSRANPELRLKNALAILLTVEACIEHLGRFEASGRAERETASERASWLAALRTLRKKHGFGKLRHALETVDPLALTDGDRSRAIDAAEKIVADLFDVHQTYRRQPSDRARALMIPLLKLLLEKVPSQHRPPFLTAFNVLTGAEILTPAAAESS
jgi:hypothetical protein